jgi:hypothetical protein
MRRVTLALETDEKVKMSYSSTGPVPAGCEGARTGSSVTPERVRPWDGRVE